MRHISANISTHAWDYKDSKKSNLTNKAWRNQYSVKYVEFKIWVNFRKFHFIRSCQLPQKTAIFNSQFLKNNPNFYLNLIPISGKKGRKKHTNNSPIFITFISPSNSCPWFPSLLFLLFYPSLSRWKFYYLRLWLTIQLSRTYWKKKFGNISWRLFRGESMYVRRSERERRGNGDGGQDVDGETSHKLQPWSYDPQGTLAQMINDPSSLLLILSLPLSLNPEQCCWKCQTSSSIHHTIPNIFTCICMYICTTTSQNIYICTKKIGFLNKKDMTKFKIILGNAHTLPQYLSTSTQTIYARVNIIFL